jgi:TP901 family phage tail tape measure protein
MATSTIARLLIKIGVQTKDVSKGMGKVKDALGGTEKKAKGVGAVFGKLAKTIATGWIGKKIITETMKFETALVKLGQFANVSGKDLEDLGDIAQSMATKFGVSSSDIAEGMSSMAKTGIETADAIKLMPPILKFSKVAGAEFSDALGMVEGTMKMFKLTTNDTGMITDVFTTALKMSKQTASDFSTALSYAGPSASSAGQSIQELSTALAILAERKVKGSSAGTALSRVFTELTKPSKQASNKMKELGINIFGTGGKMKPLMEIVKEFQGKLKGLNEEQKNTALRAIFGEQAFRGFAKLMSASPEEIDKYTKALANSQGTTEKFFNALDQTTQEKLKKLVAGLENLAQNIGKMLQPVIKEVADALNVFFEKMNDPSFREFVMDMIKWAGIIGGIVAGVKLLGVTLSFLTSVVGVAKKAWSLFQITMTVLKGVFSAVRTATLLLNSALLANPIAIIVIAVLGLVAILIYLWNTNETFRTAIINIWNAIKSFFAGMPAFFTRLWSAVVTATSNAWKKIKEKVSSMWDSIKSTLSSMVTNALTWGKNLVKSFADGIMSGIKWVTNAVSSVAGAVKKFLGIASPSEFGPLSTSDKWMPNFMQMLSQGIEMGIPKVESAVMDVAATIATVEGSGSNGRNISSTNHVNVYPQRAQMDSRTLVRELNRVAWMQGGMI